MPCLSSKPGRRRAGAVAYASRSSAEAGTGHRTAVIRKACNCRPTPQSGTCAAHTNCERVGLTYRKARKAGDAVFKVIQEGVRNHPSVETPIGTFRVKTGFPFRVVERWGRKVVLGKQRLRVDLNPKQNLLDG